MAQTRIHKEGIRTMAGKTKLSMAALKAEAKKLKLKLPKGDTKIVAGVIKQHFHETYEEDSLAVCELCGYESPVDYSVCPYCGANLGEAEELPPPKKTKKTKATKGKATKTKPRKKGKTAEKQTKEIAPPDPKMIAECEERVDAIKGLRKKLADDAYEIGKHIQEIHDKNLWKAKGYDSFSAFCKAELDYTRVMAYKYMSMSRLLKKEDAVKLGVSKAEIVTNAPKRHRTKMLNAAKKGATREELRRILAKATGKTSGTAATESKITLLGRVKDGSYEEPWLNIKSGKPTTRETDNKHVVFDATSDVRLTITENVDSSGLVLSWEKIEAE